MIVRILLFAALALVALMIFSGVYVFMAACLRKRERPWLDSEALKGTVYEKYDNLIHESHRWLLENGAQDIYTRSEEGLKLHGLWVPAENAKGTIILAHGYRSTVLVDFGKVLKLYHDLGLNLLLPQQRSHGESQGKVITFGVKESRDMLKWLEMHNSIFGDYQVILSGLSMGASTMMYLADKKLPDNVKGIIVDCGFTSPAAIISSVFTKVTHLSAVPIIWVTDICARIFGRFSLYDCDSKKTLAKNRLPIIMVHGKADDFVPCYMTQQGFACCTGPKQLLLVEGAGHGLSFLYATQEYIQIVEQFLKDHIEGF